MIRGWGDLKKSQRTNMYLWIAHRIIISIYNIITGSNISKKMKLLS